MSHPDTKLKQHIEQLKLENKMFLTPALFKKAATQLINFRRDLVNERIPAAILPIRHLKDLPVTALDIRGQPTSGIFIGYCDFLNPKTNKPNILPVIFSHKYHMFGIVDPSKMTFSLSTQTTSTFDLLSETLKKKYKIQYEDSAIGSEDSSSVSFELLTQGDFTLVLILTNSYGRSPAYKQDPLEYKLENSAKDVRFYYAVKFPGSQSLRLFQLSTTGGTKVANEINTRGSETSKTAVKLSATSQPYTPNTLAGQYLDITPFISYNEFSTSYGLNSIDRFDRVLEFCRQKHFLPAEKGTYTEGSTTSRGHLIFPATDKGKFNQNLINDKNIFDSVRKKLLNLVLGFGIKVMKFSNVEIVTYYKNAFYTDFFSLLKIPNSSDSSSSSLYDETGKAHKAMLLRFISPPFFMQVGDEMIFPAISYINHQLATAYIPPVDSKQKDWSGRQKRGNTELQTFEGALDAALKLDELTPNEIARILYLATF